MLRTIINDIQEQFVDAVAKGRDLSVEKVGEIADGRILTGAKANELGLVDVLGNFRDAVDLAKKMTGITGEVTLVYPRKSRITLLDLIFQNTSESLSRAIVDALRPELAFRWDGF